MELTIADIRQYMMRISELESAVRSLGASVEMLRAELKGEQTKNALLWGVWRRNDVIYSTDKRLFEGDNAPFPNYLALRRSVLGSNGVWFDVPAHTKQKCCKAGELYDWLTSAKLRKMIGRKA